MLQYSGLLATGNIAYSFGNLKKYLTVVNGAVGRDTALQAGRLRVLFRIGSMT